MQNKLYCKQDCVFVSVDNIFFQNINLQEEHTQLSEKYEDIKTKMKKMEELFREERGKDECISDLHHRLLQQEKIRLVYEILYQVRGETQFRNSVLKPQLLLWTKKG